MKRVEVPGMGVVEFPDNMSDDQIGAAISGGAQPPSTPAPSTRIQSVPSMVADIDAQKAALASQPGGTTPFLKTGAATGISMAGSLGGAALGGALGTAIAPGPGTVAGGIAGELAGSYGARKANVALGLDEPGIMGDVASVAIPGALKAGGSIIKGVAKRLPGVGDALHDEGIAIAKQLKEKFLPPTKSGVLYDTVAQMNPSISLGSTGKMAQDYLAKSSQLPSELQNPTLMAVAEGLENMASAPTPVQFQTMRMAQRRIRDLMGSAKGEELGMLKRFDSAMWEDLERRSAQGGGQNVAGVLKDANKAYRKEQASEELGEIIERGITEFVQGKGTGRLNAGGMIKNLDARVAKDDMFAGSWTKEEMADIKTTLEGLSKIPNPFPGSGSQFGAGMGVGAGGLGMALTGDPTMSGLLAAGPWIIGSALGTSPGRALVRQLSHAGNLMTPEGMTTIRAFINSQARDMDMLKQPNPSRGPSQSQNIMPMGGIGTP